MPVASVADGAQDWPRPPIRLRFILFVGVCIASCLWLYPRAGAAWHVYGQATELANYGRCMVGPTGPALIRANPSAYRVLLRQRLITSAADARPFAKCAPAAKRLAGIDADRAHMEPAANFVEFGSLAKPRVSLDDLGVSMGALTELGRQAWPFVRGGVTRLVKPSSSGPEAMHPVPLAEPAAGTGLPAWDARYRVVQRSGSAIRVAIGSGANLGVYESRDGGVRWREISVRSFPLALAERCGKATDEASFRFQLSEDGQRTVVVARAPHSASRRFEIASRGADVFAAACDESSAVLALRSGSDSKVSLFVCAVTTGCREMALPTFGDGGPVPRYPLDVARVGRTTVLAVAQGGIVRVASTRDDGETWTPFAVAFDSVSMPQFGSTPPHRLLADRGRVLLYAGGERGAEYGVLLSEDGGASWRTP